MHARLLKTKLHVPPALQVLISRPRLEEKLEGASECRLILVSAPAGSGKTTVLAQWLRPPQDEKRPLAWVSLDRLDNDPVRFWSYFVAALSELKVGFGEDALEMLRFPQSSAEQFLTALVNEILETPYDCTLVLDNYHVIDSAAIHEAVAFLLDHATTLHLVIAGRNDPPLPLSRLRARGQLTEIRADALSFRSEEAEVFLREMLGREFSAEDVAELVRRTEGWAAGLQLAAHAMRDREAPSTFLPNLSGSQRYVRDYLMNEVFLTQPEDVQEFLLKTSVLRCMSAPLCEQVTGRKDAQQMLEKLEGASLFAVPLDEQRGWYRYHRLFAEFLEERLRKERADQGCILHQRASEWHEKRGSLEEAVHHALYASDWERTARLVELGSSEVFRRGEAATLLGWLERLPEEQLRARPKLCVTYARALMIAGQLEAAEDRLEEVERQLTVPADESQNSGRNPAETSTERRKLLGQIMAVRSHLAGLRENLPRVVELSNRALGCLPGEDQVLRRVVSLGLGRAYYLDGDAPRAIETFAAATESGWLVGPNLASFAILDGLGKAHILGGKLRYAAETYRRGFRALADKDAQSSPGVGYLHLGLGQVLGEWNELDAAASSLQKGIEFGRRGGLADLMLLGHVYLAHTRQAQGYPGAALELVEKAQLLAEDWSQPRWVLPLVEAHRVRLLLQQGRLDVVSCWARDLAFEGVPGYPRETMYTTLVQVRLAQGRPEEALNLLQQLLETAQCKGRRRSEIELLSLKAVTLWENGERGDAMRTLERGLALAEPESYVKVFVDRGTSMSDLLRRATASGLSPNYTGKLLGAFEETTSQRRRGAKRFGGSPPSPADLLTDRESQVLRLVASGLSNRQIAKTLILSVGTVKKHVHNVLRKLEANSRSRAVARARELNILP